MVHRGQRPFPGQSGQLAVHHIDQSVLQPVLNLLRACDLLAGDVPGSLAGPVTGRVSTQARWSSPSPPSSQCSSWPAVGPVAARRASTATSSGLVDPTVRAARIPSTTAAKGR